MTKKEIMGMSLEELQDALENESWDFAIYREANQYITELLQNGTIQWQEIINGDVDSEHFFACWDSDNYELKTVRTEEDAKFEMMDSLRDCYGIPDLWDDCEEDY